MNCRPIVLGLIACTIFTVALSVQGAQTQYDSGDPTADEQYVLEMINRARANPTAEGTRLGININEGLPNGQTATVKPPLAMNKILLGTSRAHSQDMYTRKFFGHTNPDGKDPFDRMTAAGYVYQAAGENIAAGSLNSAASLEDILMVDNGEPGRGHRVNLLSTDPSYLYREIGVGYLSGLLPIIGSTQQGVNGLKDFITQDFGKSSAGPFILGVVYTDANSNNFYDAGEGIAGVTITPDSGNFFAITGTAGGFAIPVGTSGTVTLTASGGTLAAPVQMQVTLTGFNVKADFVITAGSGGTVAPTITSSLTASGTQNTAFSYTLTASGSQPITYTATGLPAGLTLTNATISGTPTQAGTFNVTIGAQNAKGADTKTLVITVSEAQTPPTINSPLTASGTLGTPFSYTVTASGSQPITFTATGLPPGLTFDGTTISGTPTKAGQFMVPLTATNAQGSSARTLVLTVVDSTVAPVITSPLAATGTQLSDFTYRITATGTQPITYSASGLPGGLVLSADTITGQPNQSGTFMITLFAKNSAGTDTETLVLTLTAAVFTSNSILDSDGDGFPDEIETFLGTSPNNPSSTPFNGAIAAPQALTLTSRQIHLNFARSNSDTIALAGTLPISAGFAPLGQNATLDVGGVLRMFTFDAHGMSNTPGIAMFKIRIKTVKGAVLAQTAPFTIHLARGSFAASLSDEGLVNATVTSTTSVPVIILFNGQYFTSTVTAGYKASANRTGVMK